MGKTVTTTGSRTRKVRGYRELDLVPMPEAIPELGIELGALGTVDHVYEDGLRIDVEVSDDDGVTLGYVTLAFEPKLHVVAYYVDN
jgi:Domain of unknown function (DUF4926)